METNQREKKCLCHNCPNYQQCAEALKKIGLDESDFQLLKKAQQLNDPLGYGVLGFYFVLKGVLTELYKPKRKKKWLH